MSPPGYDRLTVGEAEALVLSAARGWLETVLGADLTVHGWAGAEPGAQHLTGRGTVYSVGAPREGPDKRARWAVRHYRRGGAIAAYLDDRYLIGGQTRPEREIRASVEARARGVPTPAVVAGAWYRSGLFYRADLVTELIPDALSLAEALFGRERPAARRDLLRRAGRLVAELGRTGVVHADLNAMNVLVAPGDSESSTHVIDLDRAWVAEEGQSGYGDVMLRRLKRSLAKLGDESGEPLSDAAWSALDAGFEDAP